MSPRTKPRGPWADSACLVWEADEDGNAEHWGEIMFEGVPLGGGDYVDLSVQTSVDDHGRMVIVGLRMSKPMNARRLKGLPLEAIRNECSRVIAQEAEAELTRQAPLNARGDVPAAKRLATVGVTDRRSPEFLALVAETVKSARTLGQGGWQAVSQALPDSGGKPMSRAMAQRYMKAAKEAGHDLGRLSRKSDNVTPNRGRKKGGLQ